MYPYFYPSFFTPSKTGSQEPKIPKPMQPMAPPMGGEPFTAPAGYQEPPMTGAPQMPPVFGTTSGKPVESVPPTPMHEAPADIFEPEAGPPVTTDISYTQAYLKTQIGKKVKVEFLVGTNSTTDRIGTLVGVGISYVLLRLAETDDILMGDIYSIKFVTFYH